MQVYWNLYNNNKYSTCTISILSFNNTAYTKCVENCSDD